MSEQTARDTARVRPSRTHTLEGSKKTIIARNIDHLLNIEGLDFRILHRAGMSAASNGSLMENNRCPVGNRHQMRIQQRNSPRRIRSLRHTSCRISIAHPDRRGCSQFPHCRRCTDLQLLIAGGSPPPKANDPPSIVRRRAQPCLPRSACLPNHRRQTPLDRQDCFRGLHLSHHRTPPSHHHRHLNRQRPLWVGRATSVIEATAT